MSEEQREIMENVRYRMEAEGFDYCFRGYSNWEDVEDEEFHKLRLEYIKSAERLEKYVEDKLDF
jgi:hypothetical protein